MNKSLYIVAFSLAFATTGIAQNNEGQDKVIDLGTQTTTELRKTQAVSTIYSDELDKNATTSPYNAIYGLLPGLSVMQNTSWGTDKSRLNVRGRGSLNGDTPLFVVDGFARPLEYINLSEIESISVLKDGAATALWGGRGANGVVLITTKRGIYSQKDIKVDYKFGLGFPVNQPEIPIRKIPSHPIIMIPFAIEPIIPALCVRFSSEKLFSPIANPYTDRSIAQRLIPPTIYPYCPCKKNASKTAVTNKTSETAASTADSFPCCASLFFANAYLYLFAINFSPQVIADKKKQISKSRPCCIQYHIIYVKAPNLCNKLDDLYRNTKPKSCQYDQPSASHFVQNNRQYKSKWKKTNYISKKICNYRHKSKLFPVYPETPYLNKRYQIISVLSFFHCCSSVFF